MLRKLEGVNARYGADGPSSILVYHTRIGLFWASDKDGERYMKDFISALVGALNSSLWTQFIPWQETRNVG